MTYIKLFYFNMMKKTKNQKLCFLLFLVPQLTLAELPKVPESEKIQIFKAAKFKKTGLGWESRCSLVHIPSYGDFNKDGRPDAIVFDGGSKCYSRLGSGFYLLTQQKNKQWTKIFNSEGTPEFLTTYGRHGWPDISINDSSTCFLVYKWNGHEYKKDRFEYKKRSCGSVITKKSS